MTVSDLIKCLQVRRQDLEVVVQYRDAGGDYDGVDKGLYLSQRDNQLVL